MQTHYILTSKFNLWFFIFFAADEDTAEDYYAEDKPQLSGKKKRGRKPKNVEPEPEPEPVEEEEVAEEDYDEKPKKRRTTKKSKKALDAMDGRFRMLAGSMIFWAGQQMPR